MKLVQYGDYDSLGTNRYCFRFEFNGILYHNNDQRGSGVHLAIDLGVIVQ